MEIPEIIWVFHSANQSNYVSFETEEKANDYNIRRGKYDKINISRYKYDKDKYKYHEEDNG